MLSNNLKIAFRNLAKHRFFSALNIFGLALGMGACLTLILILRDQLSYDRFHPDAARIFRIDCQQNDGMRLATYTVPNAPVGSLIGKIGKGAPFLIGSSSQVVAPGSGQLMLGVNDPEGLPS